MSVITTSIASDVRRPRRGRNASVGVMLRCCDCSGSLPASAAVEAVVDGGKADWMPNRSGVVGGVARNVLWLATSARGGAGRRLISEMLCP